MTQLRDLPTNAHIHSLVVRLSVLELEMSTLINDTCATLRALDRKTERMPALLDVADAAQAASGSLDQHMDSTRQTWNCTGCDSKFDALRTALAALNKEAK